jgi:hypothetical protein
LTLPGHTGDRLKCEGLRHCSHGISCLPPSGLWIQRRANSQHRPPYLAYEGPLWSCPCGIHQLCCSSTTTRAREEIPSLGVMGQDGGVVGGDLKTCAAPFSPSGHCTSQMVRVSNFNHWLLEPQRCGVMRRGSGPHSVSYQGLPAEKNRPPPRGS